jgi:hypothetical protein
VKHNGNCLELNNDEIYGRFDEIEKVRMTETTQLEIFTKSLTDQYREVYAELKTADSKYEVAN